MQEYLERYLARSQQVKAEIAANSPMLDRIRMVRDLEPDKDEGLSWHGSTHSVYSLGQLASGLWVVARIPNTRVLYSVGDLEYCAQKTALIQTNKPVDAVASFCVGVVPQEMEYPYPNNYKQKGAILLTEDLTQGGKIEIKDVPDQEYGIIGNTIRKAWYDFDSQDKWTLLEHSDEPIFFDLENRLVL